MESIPVYRAADSAVKGSGLLRLDPSDPLIIVGLGTKFTEQIKPRSTIQFGKELGFAEAEVDEVISDSQLRSVASVLSFLNSAGRLTSTFRL